MKAKDIKYIVVHCADTPASMDIGVEEITDWHVNGNGWSDIGYHYVIRRDGNIETGRNLNTPGAHVKGFNSKSWGVCWVGGRGSDGNPEDNRTDEQKMSLAALLFTLQMEAPQAKIIGHGQLNDGKSCPNFDVEEWLEEICFYDEI